MKKAVYVTLFTLLGFLISLLLHAVLEISVITLLVTDFSTYHLGLSWQQWFAVHWWGSVFLALLGVGVGLWQGVYWWNILYEPEDGRGV